MSTGARTNVGDNSLSLMRATLRAPPSKWAIEAFFRRVSAANRGRGQPRRGYRRPKPTARSDVGRLRSRRAACFLWYFLSLRKKVLPPSGRQPHRPRRSRRVKLHPGQGVCACGRTKGLSARPLETFGHRSWRENHGTAVQRPHRSRRINPPEGKLLQ